MSRLGFAITCGLLLAGTSAYAQVGSTIDHSASTTIVLPLKKTNPTFVNFAETTGKTAKPFAGIYGGSTYSSFVSVGDVISFKSSNVTAGIGVQTSSTSTVSFDFSNFTDNPVTFESLITPAELGFYLAKLNGTCDFANCGEVTGSDARLDLLRPSDPSFADTSHVSILGLAGFDFSITDELEGGDTQTYDVSAELALKYSVADGYFVDPLPSLFGPVGGTLNGFHRITGFGDAAALAYGWGETPVFLSLDSGVHHLTYSTEVHSWSQASTLECGASLIAFSGFGDPIGRGGGAAALRTSGGNDVGALAAGCNPGGDITGLTFTETTFVKPVVDDNGNVIFNETGQTAVPEPATWAMMILGFGGIGAALRRRRTLAGAHA